ncbi:MAG: hypothetical protein HY675_17785 [Chloroflexi bacterium]|nr:hypothetical protein [Chloroflexota bacterium]
MASRQSGVGPVVDMARAPAPTGLHAILASDLVPPLAVFLTSSILIVSLAAIVVSSPFVAAEISVPTYFSRPSLTPLEESLLGTWQHWDGLWYLKISTHGYAVDDYSIAFFPLYPILVKLLGDLLQTHYLLAGVVLSSLAYLAGLLYLYRLARLEFSSRGLALTTLIYLAVFPTSFFFFAVYSESLYLALTVAAFYYLRRRSWVAACLLGMLASLTRSTGLLLIVPLAIEYFHQRGFSLRRPGWDLGYLLLIPLGSLCYAVYNFFAFGDPFAFLAAQEHWYRNFALPWDTLRDAWDKALLEANIPLVTEPGDSLIWQLLYTGNLVSGQVFNLLFFALGVLLAAFGATRLRPAYTAYLFLNLLPPLVSPSDLMPLLSVPRFLLVLFPVFFVLASLGRNRFVNGLTIGGLFLLLIVFVIRFAGWYWVA